MTHFVQRWANRYKGIQASCWKRATTYNLQSYVMVIVEDILMLILEDGKS
jgi:hypothetical protein